MPSPVYEVERGEIGDRGVKDECVYISEFRARAGLWREGYHEQGDFYFVRDGEYARLHEVTVNWGNRGSWCYK